MTAQTPDTVRWRSEEWDLAVSEGDGLFDPASVGLQPTMLGTANWRGFACGYAVADDRLVLATLRIGLTDEAVAAAGAEGPTIAGRAAARRIGLESTFEDLELPVAFSGRLIVGRDFIRERYVHMGTQAPTAYRDVAELRFRDGILEGVADVSDRYAAERAQRGGGAGGGRGGGGEAPRAGGRGPLAGPLAAIRDWIRRAIGR